MTRALILLLLLAACAPITCERVWFDPVTGLYGCERPTATLPATRGEGSEPRGGGTDGRSEPDTQGSIPTPEPPRDHVTEPRDDTEPDRATDPEGWAGWKDTHPTGWRGR